MDTWPIDASYVCNVNKINNDIVISFSAPDKSVYNVRIATGGTIGNITNSSNVQLLSPSFREEKTDRIVQWTVWSNSMKYSIEGFQDFEKRYNLTQGGDESGKYSITRYVQTYNNGVDVWSTPNDNWKIKLQSHFTGGVNCLTRYRVIGPGMLLIRRVIQIDKVYEDNKEDQLGNTYIESWTPPSRAVYNSCAMNVDESNTPNWWYSVGDNLPVYPDFKAIDTRGYCIAYDAADMKNGEVFGVVYGRENIEIFNYQESVSGKHVLNTMPWDTGFGILPGINIDKLEEGDVIDTYLVLIMGKGLTDCFMRSIQMCVTTIPRPRVYKKFSSVTNTGTDVASIISSLKSLSRYAEHRTDNLANLS